MYLIGRVVLVPREALGELTTALRACRVTLPAATPLTENPTMRLNERMFMCIEPVFTSQLVSPAHGDT